MGTDQSPRNSYSYPRAYVRRRIGTCATFPTEPDSEIINRLKELAQSLSSGGKGGNGNGGKKTGQGPEDPVDALAWYISFRSTNKWGVFITRDGLLKVASYFVRQGADPNFAYQTARYFLQNHETCHFLVDRAVLTLESTIALATNSRPPSLWLDYVRRHLPCSQLEEAVCNAYAYRMADSDAKKHVRAFIEEQPPGYRDVDFSRRSAGTIIGSFQQSESQLLSDYLTRRQSDEGINRVIGLNNLMQSGSSRSGTKGDFKITRPGKKSKEKLPVFLV